MCAAVYFVFFSTCSTVELLPLHNPFISAISSGRFAAILVGVKYRFRVLVRVPTYAFRGGTCASSIVAALARLRTASLKPTRPSPAVSMMPKMLCLSSSR